MAKTAKPDVGGYRGPEVCELVGITYRQLDHWARTGLLRPSLAEAQGSGTKRLYTYHDLVELKVIKRMLDAGLSLPAARRAVDCLRQNLEADLASANLVLTSSTSVLARTEGEMFDLLAGGQGVFNVVQLSPVVSDLEADIVRIEAASDRAKEKEAAARTKRRPAQRAAGGARRPRSVAAKASGE